MLWVQIVTFALPQVRQISGWWSTEFGHLADPVREREGAHEVFEPVSLLELVVITQLPVISQGLVQGF